MQADRVLGSSDSARYRESLTQRIPIQNREASSTDVRSYIESTVEKQAGEAEKFIPTQTFQFTPEMASYLTDVESAAQQHITDVVIPTINEPMPNVIRGEADKTTTPGKSIVRWSSTYVGVAHYGYGTWDCSKFTQTAVKKATGVDISRSTASQIAWFRKKNLWTTDTKKIRPGDVLYFRSSSSPSKRHTGIYIGNGQMIDNSGTGQPIGIRSIAGRRIIGVGLASRF
jgi:cell wall-associated NlpC family hydrolase